MIGRHFLNVGSTSLTLGRDFGYRFVKFREEADSMGQYQKPSREAGEEIVSEEYGRQMRPCWLIVQPQRHQRHGLDDSKAILEAPTKKI